jgi:subtilisin-like proprotein convertase family protein
MSSFIRISCGLSALLAFAASASAQITIGASATAFTDISATGTSPGISGDDVEFTVTGAQLTAAGFTGNGLLAGAVDIRIGNNGAVIWNDNFSEVGYTNSETFMTMAAVNTANGGNGGVIPSQFICPLWDDLYPTAGQTANALDWQVVGGNLIIQWSNEDHFGITGTGFVQFEMIVYGGATIASGAPLVEFVYNDTTYGVSAFENDGASATIGFKNWGVNASANDVEFGVGGGATSQPKVGGWGSSTNVSLPHSVVVKGGVPAPTLLTPPNNSIAAANPVSFTWSSVPGAASYDIEVDGTPTTGLLGTNFSGSYSTGSHTWRARAVSASLGVGPWSSSWTFSEVTSVCSAPAGAGSSIPSDAPTGTGNGTWPVTQPTSPMDSPVVITVPSGASQIVRVKLNGLYHTFIGDVQMVLEAPSGLKYNIVCRPGSTGGGVGDGSDYSGDYSIYESIGATLFGAGAGLTVPPGDYKQEFGAWNSGDFGILNTLLGSIPVANGTWILHIYDWYAGDIGSLTSWELCFNAPTGPAVYCTAGTSSNGCVPAISANAQPSVTLAHPCSIAIANVEGQKFGIVFYGVNNTNFSPTPWANGSNSFLCVKGPTQRTGTTNSGGTITQCNGVLNLNWNTYQTNNPGSVGNPFSVGNHVYVQGWYRDPPAPKTTNLTNALDMTMTP